jgi:hypothetical protein
LPHWTNDQWPMTNCKERMTSPPITECIRAHRRLAA